MPQIQVGKRIVEYSVDSNNCYTISTSNRYRSFLRRILYQQKKNNPNLGKYLQNICGNKCCINPEHFEDIKKSICSGQHFITRISNTDAREEKPTPQKRATQVGLIKAIQLHSNSMQPDGDWIHMAGPGKVMINYFIYERAFHENARYVIVEAEKTAAHKIFIEAQALKRKLRQHPWSNPVHIHHAEVFDFATEYTQLTNRKILLVDADLCSNLTTMLKDGLEDAVSALCQSQRDLGNNFFFVLTYSCRGDKQRVESQQRLNQHIKSYGGEKIYGCSYGDGDPMRTEAWKIKYD